MTQRNTLAALARRSRTVLRKEGPAGLLKRAGAFIAFLGSRVLYAETAYLYEHSVVPRDRKQFLPRLDSWELRVMRSNAEADAVAAEGFEDFRDAFVFARRSLDAGAVVFCVYVGAELAHVGWLAVDAAGKKSIDRAPYSVAFESGQACTGGTYTIPAYRGKGLMPYVYYERFEYLRARGFTSSRNCVEVSNTSSQKAHARFNPTIYGVGRFRKVLWWQSWREAPLPGGPRRGMPRGASAEKA